MKTFAIAAVLIVVVLTLMGLWADGTSEIRALRATLAELEESPNPGSHPYFWFCPEPGECAALDGYVTWYSAHGGS